jgi:membrane protein implicated in regulation of membrane protease activity
MLWWGWCILGVVLLGVELLAVDAQFYLVFAGLAAVVVGLLGLVGLELPVALQWLLFAVLAVTAMFTLRRPIYAKLMNKPFGNVNTISVSC